MFEACELLQNDSTIQFMNRHDVYVEIALPTGSFAYTLCQTPIVYHQAVDAKLVVSHVDTEPQERRELMLTPNETKNVFSRTGQISRIDVFYDFLESC